MLSSPQIAKKFAPVRGNAEMSPEVLHEETHVPEVLRADAALKSWTLGSGLCHVGVREHLALLFEQDVVGWTHDL